MPQIAITSDRLCPENIPDNMSIEQLFDFIENHGVLFEARKAIQYTKKLYELQEMGLIENGFDELNPSYYWRVVGTNPMIDTSYSY